MQQNQIQYEPYPLNSPTADEIDLRELFSALWRGKWIIIFVTAVFTFGSLVYALTQPNIYKAYTLVAPAENASGGGLSRMAGQLGGLAALAGVNIGGAEASQTDLAVQVMKSRKFIENFIKDHNLLVPLMAAKGWELEHNKLLIDENLYDMKKEKWLREPKGLRGEKPSAQEAYEFFRKDILNINQDKENGLYTISVLHYSPYLAQKWTTWLIQDINKVMRERAISETTQNLAYLNEQLQKTAVADMRSTFYTLIEEQTKSLMLAEVQDEFVFKVVDPAVVPELRDKPNRALILILGTLLGGVISVVLVLLIFAFKKDSSVVAC